jgi:hypothetical protein
MEGWLSSFYGGVSTELMAYGKHIAQLWMDVQKKILVYFQILSWYLTQGREENRKILRQNIQFQGFPDPSPLRAKLLDTSPGVQNNFVISSCKLQRQYKTSQNGVSQTDTDEPADLKHLTSPSQGHTKHFQTETVESVHFPRL